MSITNPETPDTTTGPAMPADDPPPPNTIDPTAAQQIALQDIHDNAEHALRSPTEPAIVSPGRPDVAKTGTPSNNTFAAAPESAAVDAGPGSTHSSTSTAAQTITSLDAPCELVPQSQPDTSAPPPDSPRPSTANAPDTAAPSINRIPRANAESTGTAATTGLPVAGAADTNASGSTRSSSRNAITALAMRLHFYAGVFIGPFILIAAITGALYSISPTIESVVNHNLLHVDSTGPAKPLANQVSTAVALEPKLALAAVDPAQHTGDTTRVLFNDPSLGESEQRAVFIDPATAKSVGVSVVYGSSGSLPVRTWIDQLHRNLHLGQPGRLYSETAASWLWVVTLAGLVLWVRRVIVRRGGLRRLAWPDRSRKGRPRTMNWHAAVGVWILLPLLFLSATGMTWSTYAGAHVDKLRAELSWAAPSVSNALPGARTGNMSNMPGMNMPGMDMPGMDMPGMSTPARTEPLSADRIAQLDKVFEVTRANHIDGPVEITVPPTNNTAFVAKERRISGVLTQDAIAVDGNSGKVTDIVRYANWPLMAKLANWGIALHMGMMFGLANQLLLLLTATALITVIIRGYRMWWRRRPTRTHRFTLAPPPRRGVLREIHPLLLSALIVITTAIGWFAPMLGITLAAFLIIDITIGLIQRLRTPA